MQFLVKTVCTLPPDYPAAERQRLIAQEREKSKALSEGGKLVANWKVPVKGETVTLWEVSGPIELHELVSSLPGYAWAKCTAIALAPRNLQQHSKDPPNKVA